MFTVAPLALLAVSGLSLVSRRTDVAHVVLCLLFAVVGLVLCSQAFSGHALGGEPHAKRLHCAEAELVAPLQARKQENKDKVSCSD